MLKYEEIQIQAACIYFRERGKESPPDSENTLAGKGT